MSPNIDLTEIAAIVTAHADNGYPLRDLLITVVKIEYSARG